MTKIGMCLFASNYLEKVMMQYYLQLINSRAGFCVCVFAENFIPSSCIIYHLSIVNIFSPTTCFLTLVIQVSP